jgi:hypothetical protein
LTQTKKSESTTRSASIDCKQIITSNLFAWTFNRLRRRAASSVDFTRAQRSINSLVSGQDDYFCILSHNLMMEWTMQLRKTVRVKNECAEMILNTKR